MRDRLIELIQSKSCDSIAYTECMKKTSADCEEICRRIPIELEDCEKLADHLIANGVIVPPVSVGQKVYVYNGFVDKVVEGVVHILSYFERNRYITVRDDGSGTTPRFQEIYDVSEIGKTVFLTREEAEQKLKEGKG